MPDTRILFTKEHHCTKTPETSKSPLLPVYNVKAVNRKIVHWGFFTLSVRITKERFVFYINILQPTDTAPTPAPPLQNHPSPIPITPKKPFPPLQSPYQPPPPTLPHTPPPKKTTLSYSHHPKNHFLHFNHHTQLPFAISVSPLSSP